MDEALRRYCAGEHLARDEACELQQWIFARSLLLATHSAAPALYHVVSLSSGAYADAPIGRVMRFTFPSFTYDELAGHRGCVRCVAVLADGSTIVSGSDDSTLRVWAQDAGGTHGAQAQTLRAHDSEVTCLMALDEAFISGSADGKMMLWDVDCDGAFTCVQELVGHAHWVCCIAPLADASGFVSGSVDSTVRVWTRGRAGTFVSAQTLNGHTNSVLCAASFFSAPIGLVTGSMDRTLQVWERGAGGAFVSIQTLARHTSGVHSLAPTASATSRFVSVTYHGCLRVWGALGNARSAHCALLFTVAGIVRAECIVPLCGTRSVLGTREGTLRIVKWETRESSAACVQTISVHDRPVTCAAPLADGRLVSGSYDRTLRVHTMY